MGSRMGGAILPLTRGGPGRRSHPHTPRACMRRCQMKGWWAVVAILATGTGMVSAQAPSPVSVEIVTPDGRGFREIPLESRDGALRSYLQAERGARYQVRVRNTSGERLGLVIAV